MKNKRLKASYIQNLQSYLTKSVPSLDRSFLQNPVVHVSGTMFVVRATLCQPLKDLISIDRFEYYQKSGSSMGLSHAVEVLFLPNLILTKGFKVLGLFSGFKSKKEKIINKILFLLRSMYQDKITESGKKRIVKVLKIPVYIKHLKS